MFGRQPQPALEGDFLWCTHEVNQVNPQDHNALIIILPRLPRMVCPICVAETLSLLMAPSGIAFVAAKTFMQPSRPARRNIGKDYEQPSSSKPLPPRAKTITKINHAKQVEK